MIGRHWAKARSKSQSLVALSSVEFELYASAKATAEGLVIKSMTRGLRRYVHARVLADAPAALGIIARRGMGQVRHLDTSHLWIEGSDAKRRTHFEKASGTNNRADLMAKGLGQAELTKRSEYMNACFPEGRVEGARKFGYR